MSLPRGGPDAELHAACEVHVDELQLPHRFTTRQLRDAIARTRGKPIELRPMDSEGAADAPCGLRIELDDVDLLFYERGTSRHHQRHILTHELAHVWRDHPGSVQIGPDAVHAIDALGVDPTMILRMSGRTSYSREDEREAEMLATVIRQRMYRDRLQPARRPQRTADRWDALFAQPGGRAWGQP